jgi:predicted membrane protein
MRIQKPDRLVGYVLLIIGVILILIPVITSILILFSVMPLFIYVPIPAVNGTDSIAEEARVLANTFPLLNLIPTFLLFVVLVYAGSVFMGKGVGLIKDITLQVAKAPEKEATEPEEAMAPELKRQARKAKAQET